MHRRALIKAGLVTGAAATTGFRVPESADSRRHYELRNYELRSDVSSTGLRNFYKDAVLPAYARAGAGAIGLFAPETGFPSQSLLVFIEYPSLAAVQGIAEKVAADGEFMAAQKTMDAGADLPYLRYDAQLMRAFEGHPSVDVPPGPATRPARVFELRTYETRTATALERKIAMFNEAEIGLFRSIGMTPVFFGENLFGTRLPSLTYMLTFEDMTARYRAWATFGSHPDWQRISKDPKYAAVGTTTVSNVAYVKPLPFSPIR
ncbi:MAG: family containing protein [Gemmatimonadetes bacterium]|nr:family containing protein [Gemmatimonadota bacterium]